MPPCPPARKAALEKTCPRAKEAGRRKSPFEAELAAVQSNEESDLETVISPLAGAEELPPVVAAPVAQPADEACPEDTSCRVCRQSHLWASPHARYCATILKTKLYT